MAEEEGFDSAQYEGGSCWHVLVCYTRTLGNKGFTLCLHKHSVPAILISPCFVAQGRLRLASPRSWRHQKSLERFFLSWKLVAKRWIDHTTGFGLTTVAREGRFFEVTAEARTCRTARLEKEFGRDMKTRTEALDMILVQLSLAA